MRWLNEMIEEFFDLIDRIFRSFGTEEPAPDFEQTVLEMLDILNRQLNALHFGEKAIMTAVQVEQEDIDAIAADLASVGDKLGQEIADLEAKVEAGTPLAAGDLAGLRAAQSALDGLAVPATTPPADGGGDTPPADGGDAPVDGGDTPPADA